jgi:hypothetical protein
MSVAFCQSCVQEQGVDFILFLGGFTWYPKEPFSCIGTGTYEGAKMEAIRSYYKIISMSCFENGVVLEKIRFST